MALTRRLREPGVLPDFLIIGAMKSGTSTLFAMLCQHPGVLRPVTKELQYFSNPRNYRRGELWYRGCFPPPSVVEASERALGYRPLTGEATPAMSLPEYAERAARLLPEARLVVTLRNPVDRAYSHYQHMALAAIPDRRAFEHALEQEVALLEQGLQVTHDSPRSLRRRLHNYGYLNRGHYVEHLSNWLRHYPRERVLILNFDAWKSDARVAAARVAGFLGLPAHDYEAIRANEGAYRKPMAAATRDWLTEYYRPYNRRLFEMLGEDWGWPC
ncbi:MAG TPA: hypothetical protein DD491_01445 [Halieaceae bacterium]|nr:hypothetical protein [Halieaceae bacterium]